MLTDIKWHAYKCNKTARIVQIRVIKPGKYKTEHGETMNVVELNKRYTWIGDGRYQVRLKKQSKWTTNINGFKVRIQNEKASTSISPSKLLIKGVTSQTDCTSDDSTGTYDPATGRAESSEVHSTGQD